MAIGMTDLNPATHLCPRPGCERRISATLFCCRTHWFELPADLRRGILRVAREGGRPRGELVDALRYWASKDAERAAELRGGAAAVKRGSRAVEPHDRPGPRASSG